MTAALRSPVTTPSREGGAPQLRSVLVMGGTPDSLNRNLSMRDAVVDALAERLGAENVRTCSLPRYESAMDGLHDAFVLIYGSALADESDYLGIAHAAKRRGFPLAFWLTDDPYEFDAEYKFAELADAVFTNDRWTRSYYRRPNVFHLPTAACRTQHFREIPNSDRQYDYDIFFCGVGFPNRQSIIDGLSPVLRKHQTLICGDEWRAHAPYVLNERLSSKQLMDHYSRSRIVLNLARDHSYANKRFMITPSTPGPRTFEAAMAGAFQMVFADRPEVLDYYQHDREIVLFSGLADFARKVKFYLANPTARMEIARAAQRRTLQDHQYVNRVDVLLRRLSLVRELSAGSR